MENSNIGRGQASSVNLPENQTCALSGTGAHSAGRIQGRPFDIRVTVRRGWEIAGMFAKTSPPQTFVSNIAQGLRLSGTGHSNPRMPNAPIGETLERIAEFSLHIARILSLFIPYVPILDWTSGLPKMEGSISLSATVAINGMVSWRLAWERHGRTRIGIQWLLSAISTITMPGPRIEISRMRWR